MGIRGKAGLIISLLCVLIFGPLMSSASSDSKSSLTGVVRGEEGRPLFGVVVCLSDGRGSEVVGLTDREGKYRFSDLHPGAYLLGLELWDLPEVRELKLVEVGAGQEVVIDFTLPGVYPVERNGVEVGWVFRGGKRDIFRQRNLAPGVGEEVDGSWFIPLRGVQLLSSMVLGEGIGVPPMEQRVVVELGEGAEERWSVVAELVERGLRWWRAEGSYRWQAAERHQVELGLSYRDHYVNCGDGGELSWWGSLFARERWQVEEPLVVSLGLRYDRYSYWEGEGFLSPQLEVSYQPAARARIAGSVAYQARGVGSGPLEVRESLLAGRMLAVERALTYRVGLEYGEGGSYKMGVAAYWDEVQDHLLNLYLPSDPQERVLVWNVGDALLSGIEVGLSKRFSSFLQGSLAYSYEEAFPLSRGRFLLPTGGLKGEVLSYGQAHDLTTTLQALIAPSGTRLMATYRTQFGYLEGEEESKRLGSLSSFDLQLRQGLPLLWEGTVRGEFYLLLKNLLDERAVSLFNLRESNPLGFPRRISTGLSFIF